MSFAQTADGIRLYYETIGKGEPLLLIAGRGNDHHLWNMVRDDFAARFHVIVYDHRGTGQSDKPTQLPYTTAGLAQDAVSILDHAGVARAHIFGVSMGGHGAQWLGINHAERVGALVLGCTSAGGAYAVRRSPQVDAVLEGTNLLKLLDLFCSRKWLLTHPRFFTSNRASAKHPTPAAVRKLHAAASAAHDTWEQLPALCAPTLVIHGSADQAVPVANAHLLAERIPNAELHIVSGGRHLFFLEFSAEVNQVVLDFLARHPLTD